MESECEITIFDLKMMVKSDWIFFEIPPTIQGAICNLGQKSSLL